MHDDTGVTVKGSPVRSLQKFIETELTAEQLEVALGSLPQEYSALLRQPVSPSQAVPVHMINMLTEAAAAARGEALEQFAIRAGREAASDAVRGMYRFFALALTPAALLGKAGMMWGALYNRGALLVKSQTSDSAHLVLADFPSELAGCSRMTGWIERIAAMTGSKDIVVKQTQCFARGDANCEWQITWK